MKKVIKLNENDLEYLVSKILKETNMNEVRVAPKFKRSDLKPAKAMVNGVEKLVIVDKKKVVQAIGPDMVYLEGANKKEICKIAEILISGVFDFEGDITDHLLGESQGFTNVEPIKYCPRV